jgi:hypothetical protein
MPLVIINFKNLADETLQTDARHIKHSMTDNADLPNPEPTVEQLGIDIDEYSESLDNLGTGVHSTLIKKEKRKKLEGTLREMGIYVESVAKGDIIIAESSGFKLRAKPSPVGVLPKPSMIKVVPAPAKGSVKLSINKISGAKNYLFQYKLGSNMTDDRWIDIIDSQSSVVISNLQSGQEYIFRVVAIGTNPTRVYSDEVKSFVL